MKNLPFLLLFMVPLNTRLKNNRLLNRMFLLGLLLTANQIKGQNAVNTELLPKHKIVMQINSVDPLVHKGRMKQLNNLKNDRKAPVHIKVECHDSGMDFLNKDKDSVLEDIVKMMDPTNSIFCLRDYHV
jgi:hypothetical protein